MKRLASALLGCAIVAGFGCQTRRESPQNAADSSQSAGDKLAVEELAVAEKALGSGVEVLAIGDLAHNGQLQMLAANRTVGDGTNEGAARLGEGVRVTRAVVLERQSATWREMLRCDEYLKNPRGFLGGAPREPVTGWRLRMETRGELPVRELDFTPLESGQPLESATVQVQWNPAVDRYQSRSKTGQFWGELLMLDIPGSELR